MLSIACNKKKQLRLSFDAYHRHARHIFRVIVNAQWDAEASESLANAPNAVGPAAKAAIPGVEEDARLLKHEFGGSAFVQVPFAFKAFFMDMVF